MRSFLARAQIDNTSRRVQEQWVGVPLIDSCSETTIGLCQPLDSCNGLCACQYGCRLWLFDFHMAKGRKTRNGRR
jgi:hypothetical protein